MYTLDSLQMILSWKETHIISRLQLPITYISEIRPYDELLYQVTTGITVEELSEQDSATMWPYQP